MNLEITQTDTKTYKVTITESGVAVNIAGHLLFFTVKEKLSDMDSSALISKTVTCPNNTDSQAGIGYIVLSSSDTNIAAGNYSYDMKYQNTISFRKTIVSGQFRVNTTVTKRIS